VFPTLVLERRLSRCRSSPTWVPFSCKRPTCPIFIVMRFRAWRQVQVRYFDGRVHPPHAFTLPSDRRHADDDAEHDGGEATASARQRTRATLPQPSFRRKR